MMIVMTPEQAVAAAGYSSPENQLRPVPLADGVTFVLGLQVLDDPAHAHKRDLLLTYIQREVDLESAMPIGWPWDTYTAPTIEDARAKILAMRTDSAPKRSYYVRDAKGLISLVRDGAVVLTFDPEAQGPDEDAYRAWTAGGGVPV